MTPAVPLGPAMDLDRGESLLRPVRSHHAFESCVERLATAIRLGGHPRGSALPTERILAERPGVSRATLREAIAACADGGFRRDAPGSRRWHRRRPPAAEARGGVAVVLARRTSGRLGVPADRRAGAAHPAAKAADPDARRHAQGNGPGPGHVGRGPFSSSSGRSRVTCDADQPLEDRIRGGRPTRRGAHMHLAPMSASCATHMGYYGGSGRCDLCCKGVRS